MSSLKEELLRFTEYYLAKNKKPIEPHDHYLELAGWLSHAAELSPEEQQRFFLALDGRERDPV